MRGRYRQAGRRPPRDPAGAERTAVLGSSAAKVSNHNERRHDTMTESIITEDEIKEDESKLRRVTLDLCVLCLNGAGGECHSPGCALWINRAPDIPVNVIEGLYYSFTRDELIDAISTLEAHVATSGPLAGKILADSMADAIIAALAGVNRAA